jgi:tetratricopeptide (TPR) repeat protein
MSKPALQSDQPLDIATAFRRALDFQRGGRVVEAERIYSVILRLEPNHVDALNNRGSALRRLGRHEEALASYGRALALKPDNPYTLHNHGNALQDLARHSEALASYERALAVKPDHAGALLNRGNVLHELGRYKEALASYERALAIKPDFDKAWNSLGATLRRLGRDEEALASYEKALAASPNFVEAHCNRGHALCALNRHKEAIASYEKAVAIKPDFADAHWNESIARLALGDYKEGWKKFEWRWKTPDCASKERDFGVPLWLGDQPLNGRTILLHAEPGLGNTIQFARYAPLVAAKGGTVILEVPAALKALMGGLAGVSAVFAQGERLPAFDLQCPLFSLPLALRTEVATIPAKVPYLAAAAERVELWQSLLPAGRRIRVGLVWSGKAAHRNDHRRSLALAWLAPLFAVRGVQFVSLQREVRDRDVQDLRENPNLLHFGGALTDFAETAALISLLDLVISVDTAAAHLAGALCKPVWVMLPFAADFRWLTGREDSPWYPTARLFRQSKLGEWDEVVGRVGAELLRVSSQVIG